MDVLLHIISLVVALAIAIPLIVLVGKYTQWVLEKLW